MDVKARRQVFGIFLSFIFPRQTSDWQSRFLPRQSLKCFCFTSDKNLQPQTVKCSWVFLGNLGFTVWYSLELGLGKQAVQKMRTFFFENLPHSRLFSNLGSYRWWGFPMAALSCLTLPPAAERIRLFFLSTYCWERPSYTGYFWSYTFP